MADFNVFATARDVAKSIRKREVSSREVVKSYLAQIERVNPDVNAIVSLDIEKALKEADKADAKIAKGHITSPFLGLPIAIKDTHDAKGFPTTFGSVPLRDNIVNEDDLIVERLKNAGAFVIGKTNTPEFAAGSHTFNEIFGLTRNPYNLDRSAGGSSGGAASAIATGMLPFADGSDIGGSLRNPAAFNNVVGFRPSPGRIPEYPKKAPYSPLGVQGPITRDVKDAAFMMSILAGPDSRSPISIEERGDIFLSEFEKSISQYRIAWSADFEGAIPVDPDVQSNILKQVKVFEDLGCQVEEVCPDFTEADEAFHTFRAWELELSYNDLVNQFPDLIKPSFIKNFNKGLQLQGVEIGRSERLRSKLYHRMRSFFDKYDALILPVTQVPPFDADLEYPKQIAGTHMKTYMDWMRSCYYVSICGNPALSVPGGFTSDGLPIGMQIVGPHRGDYKVLQIGYAHEQATGFGKRRPKIADTSLYTS